MVIDSADVEVFTSGGSEKDCDERKAKTMIEHELDLYIRLVFGFIGTLDLDSRLRVRQKLDNSLILQHSLYYPCIQFQQNTSGSPTRL